MEPIKSFNENIDYYLDELGKIISYKSISTDPAFKQDLLAASKWVISKLTSLGFEIKVVETSSNPVILARRIEDQALKTVLLYGHYDVQPVEPVSDWLSDPFTMDKREGRLFARGIMDNKGQFMMHVSSIEAQIKSTGHLPVNIIFLLEGDEETGSADLDKVIRENAEFLKSDVALISDGEIEGDDTPVIEAGFRGVLNCEITIHGPKEDLHSGVFGGAIANPAYEAASLISKLYDKDYKVTIPHFYDNVTDITDEERSILSKKHFDEKSFLNLSGSKKQLGEKGFNKFERTGLRPTLQVVGFKSGYINVGFKNIVPAYANVKFNFRLTEGQIPQEIYNNFKKFIETNISDAVSYELSEPDMVEAVKVSLDNEYVTTAREVLKEVYKNDAQINFVGGTLPVINAIKSYIKIPILSIPLSQEDCGMHSPNERLLIDAFKRGVEFSISFMEKLGK